MHGLLTDRVGRGGDGGASRPRWMPILTYHGVAETEVAGDPWRGCSRRRLVRHLDWLERHDYSAVPLELALRPPSAGERRNVAITFDDGYRDMLEVALPELEARAVPASVFVITGRIGGRSDSVRDPRPLLSRSQILELHARGVLVGSHSHTHRRLSTLQEGEIWDEVAGSKARLEDLLQAPVHVFCYPHHDHDARVVAAVARAGYRCALGGRDAPHAPLHLQRIDAASLSERQLWLHVTGAHRWARSRPLPRPLRSLAKRLAG
jgi:peptidoglycan/xylan/chitin deacetylase (PgdA/CDA1 family)